MGLLQLVQQHHGPGVPAHPFCQLAPLLVAHIAGRGTHQAGDGVGLHILGHVKAQQGLLPAKQGPGQTAAQLGLAHAAGSQQQKAAHRAAGVPQAKTAAADGPGHHLHRPILTDQGPAQAVLQSGQGLSIRLVGGGHGHPRPLLQHRPDVPLPHLSGLLARQKAAAALLQRSAEVPLRVPQHGRLFKVLLPDGQGHLPPGLGRPLLQGLQLRGQGPARKPGPGAALVQQVDGLVGQKAPRQIADGQVHRRRQGPVGDGQMVVALIPAAQAAQNGQSAVPVRLGHGDGLKAPLQGRVLFNVPPVFVQGGGPDDPQLPPGQGGL